MVLDQHAALFFGVPLENEEIVVAGCDRFLDKHVGAGLERVRRQLKMRRRAGGDVHHVRFQGLQHLAVIRKPCRDAEALGR